ncbi:hypothetical protein IGI04_031373 [Brassica rapa subsp. trilocularis]|uniref:S1 motif domain-containing protein n=1 Tax=Brassica rapa subsp. trilocularis TaxID=1813537 RepID=A0ABQ7KH92_BRACM|nr:hypothetical protein IGI04_042935 [Brassica rapa subsp. trilocularis]KAG5389832.1 hypothetical protein IGI04_031373 [Brassica rapa subsp. trilocularis]
MGSSPAMNRSTTVKSRRSICSRTMMLNCLPLRWQWLLDWLKQTNICDEFSGKGCVFTYAAVGSYEKVGYSAQGSGSTLIMRSLTISSRVPARFCFLPVDLVNTVFASATERDIYTGDKLEIMILKADDIRTEVMELRKD